MLAYSDISTYMNIELYVLRYLELQCNLSEQTLQDTDHFHTTDKPCAPD